VVRITLAIFGKKDAAEYCKTVRAALPPKAR
jgi:hypothetical protein